MWFRSFALTLLLLSGPALADVKENVAALAPEGWCSWWTPRATRWWPRTRMSRWSRSVAKIVTAWLAMEVLGGDYRFATRFYLDKKRVLYVRGGGDPFLISEELATLATALVATVGMEPITGIVLDASYYPANLRIRASRTPTRPTTR